MKRVSRIALRFSGASRHIRLSYQVDAEADLYFILSCSKRGFKRKELLR